MKPFLSLKRRGSLSQRGFSLIEVLAVISIMAMLSGLSWSILGVVHGNEVRNSVGTLSGVLDQSRQMAIAKNTTVWVAFTQPPAGSDRIFVAVIGSISGLDPILWTTQTIQLAGHADLELLGKVRSLPKIELVDAGTISLPNLPAVGGGVSSSLATVAIEIEVGGEMQLFTRAIQFTPTGEARVNPSAGTVEMGIRPTVAGNSANVAVLRLAGVTGKISIYRP